MGKGYVLFIFKEPIADQAHYDAYVQRTLPTIVRAGGRLVIANDRADRLEGGWDSTRVVMLEFDSLHAARQWYHSDEYLALVPERQALASADVAIVEGVTLGH